MNELSDTVITVSPKYGKQKIANLTIENALFYGHKNFRGELDRFNDNRRKFTVKIPLDLVDEMKALGWNVKVNDPNPERPDDDQFGHLKVYLNFKWDEEHIGDTDYESGPDVWVMRGEDRERLTSQTVGLLDRARIEKVDMEIRGWEYNPEEHPNEFSARLVSMVVFLRASVLDDKYGHLGR